MPSWPCLRERERERWGPRGRRREERVAGRWDCGVPTWKKGGGGERWWRRLRPLLLGLLGRKEAQGSAGASGMQLLLLLYFFSSDKKIKIEKQNSKCEG